MTGFNVVLTYGKSLSLIMVQRQYKIKMVISDIKPNIVKLLAENVITMKRIYVQRKSPCLTRSLVQKKLGTNIQIPLIGQQWDLKGAIFQSMGLK